MHLKYQVYIGRIMLTLGLLVFISTVGSGKAANTNVSGGCTVFHYMVNETCFRCAENCTTCVSDINCTLCRKGFYGPVCENKCDFSCAGTCHKKYGHCTYGCSDGTYPADDNSCQPCSSMCSLCASKSHCIVCNSAHFLDAVQCSLTNGNDTSLTNHAMTIITDVDTVFVVACLIVVLMFDRKQCSTNAWIKRKPTLKKTSSTRRVKICSRRIIRLAHLVTSIHCTEGLKVEKRVDGGDVNKTEDAISDIDPDIKVNTGTDTHHSVRLCFCDYA